MYTKKGTRLLQCGTNMDTWREEEERKAIKDNIVKDGGGRKDSCQMEIVEWSESHSE